ncbi:hypothetical protein V6N13_048400 [Hibiscus sabdariffa]
MGALSGTGHDAGIGGVLRDYLGKILLLFSKSVGTIDEVVKEANLIFIASRWYKKVNLILDSSLVQQWLTKPHLAPYTLKNEILTVCNNLSNCKLDENLIPREQNTNVGSTDLINYCGWQIANSSIRLGFNV